MPAIHTDCCDSALTTLDAATTIHICSAEPAVGALANATAVSLGNKNFGAGGCFGAPAAGSPNGRKAASTAITDGVVTASGTAVAWAAVDGTRTLATGAITSQAVTSGNTFTLTSFTVTIPNQ
jgi:uncharacterized metal-binding protein